ncbi:MAG: 2-isopropylmalate synthase [Victivallales bacterium]|nr:2-isopropylmalate synthase [Victivallales bacterium]
MSGSPHFAKPSPPSNPRRRWPSKTIRKAPRWCAVDLRDGNQALPKPMSPEQKLEYFRLLTDIGFKEIEVGFPAASQDEWLFCRELIEKNLIPDDVTISVLTQARPHIIRKTMEAIRGAKHATIHLYIATSQLFSQFVLKHSRQQIRDMVLASVRIIKRIAQKNGQEVGFEFSPEEFTDSNMDFIVELCDSVVDEWNPKSAEKVIINLPETVERTLPMGYADMIETFCRRARNRRKMVVSLHAHNDMGSAVADTELALQAGGERVEGTLFGHGERAGNTDLVILALNLQYIGIETGLDFSNLERLSDKVTELTDMTVPVRQPYAGELAFTAFAGSHQDAINKCLAKEEAIHRRFHGWKMPYLHIDPAVIGRRYQDFIRITSQSGKGGIDHILKNAYGVNLPRALLVELAEVVQMRIDSNDEREYTPQEIWNIFLQEYVRQDTPLQLMNFWPRPDAHDPTLIHAEVHIVFNGEKRVLNDSGHGPVAAFAAALRQLDLPAFLLVSYEERAIGTTVNAQSITIVKLTDSNEVATWGVGFGANIVQGACQAIISGINRMMTHKN